MEKGIIEDGSRILTEKERNVLLAVETGVGGLGTLAGIFAAGAAATILTNFGVLIGGVLVLDAVVKFVDPGTIRRLKNCEEYFSTIATHKKYIFVEMEDLQEQAKEYKCNI